MTIDTPATKKIPIDHESRHPGFWFISVRQQAQIRLMDASAEDGWVEYGEANAHRVALLEEGAWDPQVKREAWVRFGCYRVSSTVSIEDAIDKAFGVWRAMYTSLSKEQAEEQILAMRRNR